MGLARSLDTTRSLYKIIIFLYTSNEQLEIKILKNPNRIISKWYCYFIEAESRFNTMNNIVTTKKSSLLTENKLLNDCQFNGESIDTVHVNSWLC